MARSVVLVIDGFRGPDRTHPIGQQGNYAWSC